MAGQAQIELSRVREGGGFTVWHHASRPGPDPDLLDDNALPRSQIGRRGRRRHMALTPAHLLQRSPLKCPSEHSRRHRVAKGKPKTSGRLPWSMVRGFRPVISGRYRHLSRRPEPGIGPDTPRLSRFAARRDRDLPRTLSRGRVIGIESSSRNVLTSVVTAFADPLTTRKWADSMVLPD